MEEANAIHGSRPCHASLNLMRLHNTAAVNSKIDSEWSPRHRSEHLWQGRCWKLQLHQTNSSDDKGRLTCCTAAVWLSWLLHLPWWLQAPTDPAAKQALPSNHLTLWFFPAMLSNNVTVLLYLTKMKHDASHFFSSFSLGFSLGMRHQQTSGVSSTRRMSCSHR